MAWRPTWRWVLALALIATTVTVLAVGAVVFIAVAGSSGDSVSGCRLRSVDENDYVAGNEALLRSVPVYPGARRLTTYSIGQTSSRACLPVDNGPPYGSFMTSHVYTLPKGESSDTVLDFYDRALLPQWQQAIVRTPEYPTCEVSYRRGEALLGISACNGYLMVRAMHDVESR